MIFVVAITTMLYYSTKLSNGFAASDHWMKGSDAEIKGDHERAVAEYQQALRYEPNNFYYRYELGRAYEQQKKYDAAIAEYQKAARSARTEADYPYGLSLVEYEMGNAYFEKGDYTGAAQAYQRVVSLPLPVKNIKSFLELQKSAAEYLEESKRLLHNKA